MNPSSPHPSPPLGVEERVPDLSAVAFGEGGRAGEEAIEGSRPQLTSKLWTCSLPMK
jgi:hypothetical protein